MYWFMKSEVAFYNEIGDCFIKRLSSIDWIKHSN